MSSTSKFAMGLAALMIVALSAGIFVAEDTAHVQTPQQISQDATR